MDYTTSQDYSIHEATGQRMHDDDKPDTTFLSARDANSVIWSLMEVIKAGGLAGKSFNADDPETYRVLLEALKKLFGYQATEVLAGLAKIATLEDVAAGVDDSTIITPAKLASAVYEAQGNLRDVRIITSGNPTLTAEDTGKLIVGGQNAAFVVTLPSLPSCKTGDVIRIVNINAGVLQLDTSTGEYMNFGTINRAREFLKSGDWIELVCRVDTTAI